MTLEFTSCSGALLGRRWQRRQASSAQGVYRHTSKRCERTYFAFGHFDSRERGLALSQRELPPAASAVGEAGLRPAGADGGEVCA
jgi:hypothetical protein